MKIRSTKSSTDALNAMLVPPSLNRDSSRSLLEEHTVGAPAAHPSAAVSKSSSALATMFLEVPEDEEELVNAEQRLATSWQRHVEARRTAARTQGEFKELRTLLCKEMYELKKKLAGRGRDGRWGEFLELNQIPRNTADNYVRKHEASLGEGRYAQVAPLSAAEVMSRDAVELARKIVTLGRTVEGVTSLLAAISAEVSKRSAQLT